MPMRLAALAYPAFMIMLALNRPSVVGTFLDVNAVSEETARRPTSLPDIRMSKLSEAVRKGYLRPTGDGRYFVNVAKYKAEMRRKMTMLTIAAVVGTVGLLYAFEFMR